MYSQREMSCPGYRPFLNAHWFLSLADAQEKLEDWRGYYSESGTLRAFYKTAKADNTQQWRIVFLQ